MYNLDSLVGMSASMSKSESVSNLLFFYVPFYVSQSEKTFWKDRIKDGEGGGGDGGGKIIKDEVAEDKRGIKWKDIVQRESHADANSLVDIVDNWLLEWLSQLVHIVFSFHGYYYNIVFP